MDLALNNLQRLICHKIKQTKPNIILRQNPFFVVVVPVVGGVVIFWLSVLFYRQQHPQLRKGFGFTDSLKLINRSDHVIRMEWSDQVGFQNLLGHFFYSGRSILFFVHISFVCTIPFLSYSLMPMFTFLRHLNSFICKLWNRRFLSLSSHGWHFLFCHDLPPPFSISLSLSPQF